MAAINIRIGAIDADLRALPKLINAGFQRMESRFTRVEADIAELKTAIDLRIDATLMAIAEMVVMKQDYESSTNSTGALACLVLDLCEHAQERLTKAAFIRLAQATARILLAATGTDETLTDVNDADNGFAAENAAVIREIWRGSRAP